MVRKERFFAFRKEGHTPCPTYLESAGIQSRAKYPELSRGASHLPRTQSNANHRRNILLDGFRGAPIRWISALIPAAEGGFCFLSREISRSRGYRASGATRSIYLATAVFSRPSDRGFPGRKYRDLATLAR